MHRLLYNFKRGITTIMPKIYQLLTDEIEEFVLQYIYEHQLKPHDKLPTERELSTSLNVNRITLRNGLQKLIDKGIIYSHRGKGYFVCPKKVNRTLCYFSFPKADSLLKNHTYKTQPQEFLPTIMSNIIHNFLNIKNNCDITISSFLESVDETIIAFSCHAIKNEYNSIYPDLFHRKEIPPTLIQSFFIRIYENKALDSLSLATKQALIDLLQLSEEDTLLLVTNFMSENDIPIACTVSVCVGTRLNLIGNIHSPN